MQIRWMNMVVIVSVAMNAAFIAAAGYGFFHNRSTPSPGMSFHSKKSHHFYEVLELSQTQLAQMMPLAASFHEQLDRLHAEMEIRKEDMVNILREKEGAEERVEQLRREMATIQDTIQKLVIAHILDVKTILDSSQQERFFKLLHESMTQEHHLLIPAGAQ